MTALRRLPAPVGRTDRVLPGGGEGAHQLRGGLAYTVASPRGRGHREGGGEVPVGFAPAPVAPAGQ
jgi:hypothetical protein